MKQGDGRGQQTNLGAASGKNNPTYFFNFLYFNCNTTDVTVLYGVTGMICIV